MLSILLLPARPHPELLGASWLMAWVLLILGFSAALTWITRHPRLSRFLVMGGVAVLLSGGIAYADLVCCGQCDAWWLEYFWICIPAA